MSSNWTNLDKSNGNRIIKFVGESRKKFSSLQFSNFGTFHGSMMQKKFWCKKIFTSSFSKYMLRHADLVGTFQFCYLLVKKLPLIQPSFRSIDQLTFNGELIIYYAASYANHPLSIIHFKPPLHKNLFSLKF